MGMGALNEYLTSDSPLRPSTSIFRLIGPRNRANTPHRSSPYLSFPLEPGSSVRCFECNGFETTCPLSGAGGGYRVSVSMACLERCNEWGNPRGRRGRGFQDSDQRIWGGPPRRTQVISRSHHRGRSDTSTHSKPRHGISVCTGKCRPSVLGFGRFVPRITAYRPHCFLPTTSSSNYGHQVPATEISRQRHLVAECGHRSRKSHPGDLKHHASQGRVWFYQRNSYYDQGAFPPCL